jgi:D-alanine-D-alanine ligase-like ATP-grasp enzyme
MDNPIRLNEIALRLLEQQGLTHESVPEANRTVRLASAANLKQGGDNIDVLKETHPSVLETAMRAVACIPGLPHAGGRHLAGGPSLFRIGPVLRYL